MKRLPVQDRGRGRRRITQASVVIPIKLKLRDGWHDDVIRFYQSLPSGARASTVVAITRAYLSGEFAGNGPHLPGPVLGVDEGEIYAALKDML